MRNLKIKSNYYVYILSSKTGTLYIGVTNNLERRILEHKSKLISGFTQKYNIDKLMFYQEFTDIEDALNMEKTIKKWGRQKKLTLIKTINPRFTDLSKS